jgi:Ca2+-binding EF-hand superfamily protein
MEVFADPSQAVDAGRNFRERLVSLFKSADRDGNGYVDMAESQVFFGMRNLYQLADEDKDGMLFEKEVTALLDKTEKIARAAAGATASLDVAEVGRGLFGVFDADGDGRLSPRELRQMAKAAEAADRDGDGMLSPADIVRRLRATIRAGSAVGQSGRPVAVPAPGMAGTPQPAPRTEGPVWFRKMDRNRDGDVSRREFLGTSEQFKEIDADGDGLIDRTEAEAADKRYKDEPPARKGG